MGSRAGVRRIEDGAASAETKTRIDGRDCRVSERDGATREMGIEGTNGKGAKREKQWNTETEENSSGEWGVENELVAERKATLRRIHSHLSVRCSLSPPRPPRYPDFAPLPRARCERRVTLTIAGYRESTVWFNRKFDLHNKAWIPHE